MSNRLFNTSSAPLHRAKTIRIALVVAILIVWTVILLPLPVFAAIANPDTAPTVWDVHVNQNVISTGDIVFTGLYNIPYATPPTVTADQTFIIRLMDPTGTTDLGSVAPFNYNGYHNGYNQGAFSLYFAAGNALTWGTTYVIQIAENPSQFASPLKWNTSLTAGMYTSVTTQTDNQTDLASQMFTIGSVLATDFNEKLFTLAGSRQVLTADGEIYFRGAINGLQSMAPALFAIQQNTLDLSSTAWTTSSTWTNYLTRFNNTWVGAAMTATGNQFGMSGNMVMGLIFIVPACMIFLILSAKRFNTTDPGLVACSVVLEMGTVMGWVSIALFATTFQLMGIYIAYLFFFSRS